MSVDIQRTEIVLNNRGARGVNGTVTVTSATGQAASTRLALAAISSPVAGQVAYLAEAGREGTFVFDSSNLTTSVSGDPAQAIYVAPSSTTSGASGAWVRRFSGAVSAKWFGATGDAATNDATALQRWLDYGGALYLPVGQYRSAATLILRKCVHLYGASYGFDGRIVGYAAMPGSRLVFDSGVAGLDIQPQWTNTDWSSGTPTQEGAMHSMIENIGLIGGGGATATGVHCRTIVHLRNIHCIQFSGKGFDIAAGVSAGDNGESGNSDLATLEYCHATSNGSHGYHLRGVDANVIKLDTCAAILNGGWGFLDEAAFANCYINCQAATNTSGSYKSISGVAGHTYTNCYVEGGTGATCDISAPQIVIGGNLAGTASGANTHSAGPLPAIIANTYSTLNALHINWPAFGSGVSLLATDTGVIAAEATHGLVIQGKGATADVTLYNQAGSPAFYINANTLNATCLGGMTIQGPVSVRTYTVATLPASQPVGTRSFVTDATANTFATVVAGGGANAVPVYYDGSWRIG